MKTCGRVLFKLYVFLLRPLLIWSQRYCYTYLVKYVRLSVGHSESNLYTAKAKSASCWYYLKCLEEGSLSSRLIVAPFINSSRYHELLKIKDQTQNLFKTPTFGIFTDRKYVSIESESHNGPTSYASNYTIDPSSVIKDGNLKASSYGGYQFFSWENWKCLASYSTSRFTLLSNFHTDKRLNKFI